MTAFQHDATDGAATLTDRRRPGRLAAVNPNLLPLLRSDERAQWVPLCEAVPGGPAFPVMSTAAGYPADRRLDAGQAIALGLLLGPMLWTAIIATGWAAIEALG